MNGWTVAVTSFLACGVEMVEALTIVLAVGIARGWRPAVTAAFWALVILVAIVVVARPVLLWLDPLPAFKIVVGLVALYYGQGWLRKAILRGAGRKALHDEAAIYAKHVTDLASAGDRAAFATAFNGVFLEGVEAVVIVLALAAGSVAALPWATGGAIAALVIVVAIGIALHRPLERVPENAMKFLVGTMLTTFGIFWIGEGAGVPWPGDDLSIALLAIVIFGASLISVRLLRATPATDS
jgi:Ca2+/H+ antiporter, TMEM165/GDT1 family